MLKQDTAQHQMMKKHLVISLLVASKKRGNGIMKESGSQLLQNLKLTPRLIYPSSSRGKSIALRTNRIRTSKGLKFSLTALQLVPLPGKTVS